MERQIITFDYIFSCWKENKYPEGFDDLLRDYLNTKAEIFSNATIKGGITSWFSKVVVAIEIGMMRDPKRFEEYKEFWEDFTGRKWKVSVEDKWVEWA